MLASSSGTVFRSWSGHTGTVVGLDDGMSDGGSVGSCEMLGVEVISIEGFDVGEDDVEGIKLGTDEGSSLTDGVNFDSIAVSGLEAFWYVGMSVGVLNN